MPNFFIDKFRIPPFLLSIYQAAGIEYGVRWEVLAAINEIETDYGRNLNVSSAGALGWMQFMPATWKAYGVDANGDKKKDPYNPVDAIFAAARYLKAAGADKDLARAIFAYNHADWYVDSVLMRARLIGGMPTDLVGSLTGLTQGMFPVHAKARYADDVSEKEATRRVAKGQNAAIPVESETPAAASTSTPRPAARSSPSRTGRIVARWAARSASGNYVKLRDAYGNTYTYARLDSVATKHPVPKKVAVSKDDIARELKLPKDDPKPTQPASAGVAEGQGRRRPPRRRRQEGRAPLARRAPSPTRSASSPSPKRPAAFKAGGEEQLIEAGTVTSAKAFTRLLRPRLRPRPRGRRAQEAEGRLEGHRRHDPRAASAEVQRDETRTLLFEIRPAGRGAPRIDPKPILDGWKLLESTAIYRAKGKNPFFGSDARTPSIGQILLMGKDELERRVLRNPRIEIYDCGRRDIQGSRIDRRVLATLEFLAASGLRPTVTSLTCGHGYFTASGNVSHHSSGNAVDIAKINGIPILGHQGDGSITDITNRRLLTLQGTMKPAQIISLMKYEDADNTFAMGDHDDHIHVGFQPLCGANGKAGKQFEAVLKPSQWIKLIDRLERDRQPHRAARRRASTRSRSRRPSGRAARTAVSEAGGAGASPLFAFVQFEFPWELGPVPGRYVLRDSAAEADLRVLVIATLGARERRLLRPAQGAAGSSPRPSPRLVPTTRATLVRGVPLDRRRGRVAEVGAGARSRASSPCSTASCTRTASAAAAPEVREVTLDQALVVRVGYGEGEQVAEGRWTEAVEPGEAPPARRKRVVGAAPPGAPRGPARRPRRRAGLRGADAAGPRRPRRRPPSRGRAPAARRARGGASPSSRPGAGAATSTRAWPSWPASARPSDAAADAALRGGLPAETIAEVERVLGRVEAALRARSAEL